MRDPQWLYFSFKETKIKLKQKEKPKKEKKTTKKTKAKKGGGNACFLDSLFYLCFLFQKLKCDSFQFLHFVECFSFCFERRYR